VRVAAGSGKPHVRRQATITNVGRNVRNRTSKSLCAPDFDKTLVGSSTADSRHRKRGVGCLG